MALVSATPMDRPHQTLCSKCHAIWVVEGMIPSTCRLCMPPRHPVCATCWPYPGCPCVCGRIHD